MSDNKEEKKNNIVVDSQGDDRNTSGAVDRNESKKGGASDGKEEVEVKQQGDDVKSDDVKKNEQETVETKGADQEKAESVSASKPVAKSRKRRKNRRRQVHRGRVYIKSSYNNTLVLFTDAHGNSLAWSSAGYLGFKGAKKATTYAANQVALDAHEKVQKYGLKDVEVFVKGVGSGRDAALRALAQKGYNLLSIKDNTPIPHNGCRPRKPRRV